MQTPPFSDRRGLERRIGERRQRLVLVEFDRRAGGDRRSQLDRREGPVGHIRNALQILSMLPGEAECGEDLQLVATSVASRLEAALREIERLQATCERLGTMVRMQQRFYG